MSVLPCDRRGCSNIMCDLYSEKYGYLCKPCFDELCQLPDGTRIDRFMSGDTEPPRGTMRANAEEAFTDRRLI